MEPYVGFPLLKKFEGCWGAIAEEDIKTGEAAKQLAITLSSVSGKYSQFGESFGRLNDAMKPFYSLVESIDSVTVVLGRLEGTFDEVEQGMSLLESIYEEEDKLKEALHVVDELHSLKIKRQKVLESLKGNTKV